MKSGLKRIDVRKIRNKKKQQKLLDAYEAYLLLNV